jgi:hypothetical protein
VNLVQLVRSALIGLALSWLLAACGPTGGGTGTGESVFTPADFGARPASACSAPFAAALACENVSTASLDVAQLPGTHDVSFAGMADSGPVTLTLSGNRATVQSRCPGPGFDGSWGVRADGQGRYFGSFSADEGGRVQRGQLWVQVQTGSADTLQVQVHDADGQLLWGPLDLRRAAADTSACR